METMETNCIKTEYFIKIVKNNCKVFVENCIISEEQMKQIKFNEIKVDIPLLCDQQIIDSMTDHKSGDNWTQVLSRMNRDLKRKSKSNTDFNTNWVSIKKIKTNFNSINININENKDKENKMIVDSGLSRVIGLPNMGNTCYINSIIQVLRITPGFTQFICFLNKSIESNKSKNVLKKENKQLISSLHNVFFNFGINEMNGEKSMNSHTNQSIIESLTECQNIKDRFESGVQQDCHEFLNWLINELNTYAELLFPKRVNQEMNSFNTICKNGYNKKSAKQWSQTITFQHFQGVMLRNIMCNECKRSSYTDDSFADIQIPLCVTQDMINQNEDFANIRKVQSFTDIIHRTDYLRDENMFDCRNCSKKTEASVVNSIKVPPKVLIIYIKKPFDYNSKITRNSKNLMKLFKVGLTLDYALAEKSIKYSLYGFVVHSGANINNGHYYAVINSEVETVCTRKKVCNCAQNVLSNKGWLRVNDNKVCPMSSTYLNKLLSDDSISSTPYLAFYKRID